MLFASRIRLVEMEAVFVVIALAFRVGYQAFMSIEVYLFISLQTTRAPGYDSQDIPRCIEIPLIHA